MLFVYFVCIICGFEESICMIQCLIHESSGEVTDSKGMSEPNFVDGVPVCDQLVEMVKEFPYLGSTISNDGEVDGDVKIRIIEKLQMLLVV